MAVGSYRDTALAGPRVESVWQVRFDATVDEWLVVPDGVVDVVLASGAPPVVAGPATRATVHRAPGGSLTVGLRVAAGAVPAVLGVAAHELRDRAVPLADIPRRPPVDAAWEAVEARRPDDAAAKLACVAIALERRRPVEGEGLVAAAAAALRADPSRPVDAVADLVGWSARQLRRRFDEHVGYGPKRYARIARLQHFLALQRAAPMAALGRLAADAGYADHAHLADDVRALTGRTPRALLAHRAATLDLR